MAQFPAFPLWTDAYLGDTTHLTTIEHGAYLLLLMTMWRSPDGKLPHDDKLLARYARMTAGQWARTKPILMPFFNVSSDSITQSRLTDELDSVRQLSERQKKKAKARHLKNKETGSAAASSGQCPAPASPTPTPNPIEKPPIGGKKTPPVASLGMRFEVWSAKQPDETWVNDWGEWAATDQRMTDAEINAELEKFSDYWKSKTGQMATKRDWFATWKNWCRDRHKFQPQQRRSY